MKSPVRTGIHYSDETTNKAASSTHQEWGSKALDLVWIVHRESLDLTGRVVNNAMLPLTDTVGTDMVGIIAIEAKTSVLNI